MLQLLRMLKSEDLPDNFLATTSASDGVTRVDYNT